MTTTDIENWVLGHGEVYKASSQVWSFKYVDDIVEGINLRLSNMAGGFPFDFMGHHWKDSERLYLCGEFSNDTERHRLNHGDRHLILFSFLLCNHVQPVLNFVLCG
jgi:hypothetical protein